MEKSVDLHKEAGKENEQTLQNSCPVEEDTIKDEVEIENCCRRLWIYLSYFIGWSQLCFSIQQTYTQYANFYSTKVCFWLIILSSWIICSIYVFRLFIYVATIFWHCLYLKLLLMAFAFIFSITPLNNRAELFEGRLALNPGLKLTRVSLSCVQKHFLG